MLTCQWIYYAGMATKQIGDNGRNVDFILIHTLRRWPNIKKALV